MPAPSNAHRISEWTFSSTDRLFFDTNVWMWLLGVQGDPADTNVAANSLAYKRILRAKSLILTDALVLAEFANAALRVRHELAIRFSDAPSAFKDYRESGLYADDAWAVCEHLTEIRAQAQVLNVEPPDDWATFSTTLQTGARDFNDEMIVLQCRRQDAILITHDRDFVAAGIPVLTHRATYFRR